MNTNTKEVSRFLSLLLRHKPETIGLELDANGWAKICDLVRLTEKRKISLTRDLIVSVVETNDKQRFALSEDGNSVRANQGHSISVELNLEVTKPPPVLYHGTATRFLEKILKEGLVKQGRQHVHLSGNMDTARKVGVRHGKLALLEIDAKQLHLAGIVFYKSENDVWLTDRIPKEFIRQIES